MPMKFLVFEEFFSEQFKIILIWVFLYKIRDIIIYYYLLTFPCVLSYVNRDFLLNGVYEYFVLTLNNH